MGSESPSYSFFIGNPFLSENFAVLVSKSLVTEKEHQLSFFKPRTRKMQKLFFKAEEDKSFNFQFEFFPYGGNIALRKD